VTAHVLIMSAAGGAATSGHRYWRINITQAQVPTAAIMLCEMAFRAAIGGPNLCSGGTAIASATTYNAPASAADGNFATYWGHSAPVWWGYDFGAPPFPYIVEMAISVRYGPNSPVEFSLDGSDDAITWTTVKSFTTPSNWSTAETRVFS
jgi:hypothetical protein